MGWKDRGGVSRGQGECELTFKKGGWKEGGRKWVGTGGGERIALQRGWRRNREGEMDRERWWCVILWTPFIYTWNKRPGLACKCLSWWGLKWNWHFQFVPWHVCLGLFTHSSASPSRAILLSDSFPTPPFPISPSPSHYSFLLPVCKPPPPSISVRLSPPYLHPPERPQSNKEIWSRFLYCIFHTCPEKQHMCTTS